MDRSLFDEIKFLDTLIKASVSSTQNCVIV